jgi:hypothetical protein
LFHRALPRRGGRSSHRIPCKSWSNNHINPPSRETANRDTSLPTFGLATPRTWTGRLTSDSEQARSAQPLNPAMRSQDRKRHLHEEGMLTPPGTPQRTIRKTRRVEDLSPSNHPSNEIVVKPRELMDCFQTSISHKEYCPEGGDFLFHKGIEPGYPKGHYCCQNVSISSDEELSLRYESPLFVVYGLQGPLGCLSAEESELVKGRIAELGGQTAVDLRVTGFSCFKDEISLKRIFDGVYPRRYAPSASTWR